jgi:HEAT repeat protein
MAASANGDGCSRVNGFVATGLAAVLCVIGSPSSAQAPVPPARRNVDELIEAFTTAKYSWQQGDVARELVAIGDKSVIPRIEPLLDTDERQRRCNAAFVLAGLGDPRGVAVLISELEDTDPGRSATERLGQNLGSIISTPGEGLDSPRIMAIRAAEQTRSDRYYAAFYLGELRDSAAVPALVKATKEPGPINQMAAMSLGKIGDANAIPALYRMLNAFPEQGLWAGYGLAKLGVAEGLDVVTGTALSETRWTERRHAVDLLALIGDRKAVPTLLKVLKEDEHVNVRVSAARSLGALKDPAALPGLTEALSDTEVTQVNAPTTVEAEARRAIEAIQKAAR